MSIGAVVQPQPAASSIPRQTAAGGHVAAYLMGGVLLLFLIANLPLFLCMPVDCDIHFYDVCARNLLQGGVHYRDTFDTNLPGMPWLHAGIRYLFGPSVEAIRVVDFTLVTTIVFLLLRWLTATVNWAKRLGMALVLYSLYFSVTEWCHCQRDVWMLVPCLFAVELRSRQIRRLVDGASRSSLLFWAAFEGLTWSIGFWIKPFVIVPAAACWVTSVVTARRQGKTSVGLITLDAAGLLCGGLVSGALGIWWLAKTGSWPYFYDIFFVWNRDYVGFDMTEDLGWLFIAGSFVRFFPWVMVHLIAVPIAIQLLWSGGRARNGKPDIVLASALYLAWLFQAVVLQHFFDYIQLPAIFLGIGLVGWTCATTSQPILRRCLIAFLIFCPLLKYPSVLFKRLPSWKQCLTQGSTPEVKDATTLLRRVEWRDLKKVEDYLRERQVQDGELTCFSIQAISLYNALDVQPATRHLILQGGYTIFSSHRDQIRAELASCPQRYIVVDLWRKDVPYQDIPDQAGDTNLPDWIFPRNFKELFPGRMALLFRAGRYCVFSPITSPAAYPPK